jgi:hypothetical protein
MRRLHIYIQRANGDTGDRRLRSIECIADEVTQ